MDRDGTDDGPASSAPATARPDATDPAARADAALVELIGELAACVESLRSALARAEELRDRRAEGRPWSEVVDGEARPLVVERISGAIAALNTAGGRFRRDEARALHLGGLSINRIAGLFGVTRQRASVLVREVDERDGTDDRDGVDGRHGADGRDA